MVIEKLVVSSPACCGLLLWAIAHLDLYLFRNGLITVRQAIAHEVIFFLLGLAAVAIVLVLCLVWFLEKRWMLVLLGGLSSLSFFIFLTIAGANGAAIINAT